VCPVVILTKSGSPSLNEDLSESDRSETSVFADFGYTIKAQPNKETVTGSHK